MSIFNKNKPDSQLKEKTAKIILFPTGNRSEKQGDLDENADAFKTAKFSGSELIPYVKEEKQEDSATELTSAPAIETITNRNSVRLDELTDSQLEKYAENYRLIKLIEDENLTPAAALKRAGAKRSVRALSYLYKRYKEEGKKALVDWRWCRQPKTTILNSSMKNLISDMFMGYPGTGVRGIQRLIKIEAEKSANQQSEEDISAASSPMLIPAVSTIHKYIQSLPESVKYSRTKRGYREYQKQGAPYMRFENTQNANELWQTDHTMIAIWIRVRHKGKWKAVRVYLTLALDVHSRAIVGFWLSTKYGDTWAIKIMLYFAIRPKTTKGWNVFGLPKTIQCDNGADFISTATRNTLSALGISIDVDHPYYPNSKGKVERVFRTLDTMLFRNLPGHFDDIGTSETSADKRVAELLTRDALKRELERIVVEYNNTVHSETERKPQEFWEETVLGPILPEDHELNICLLQHDKRRTIQGFGIRFKLDDEKHLYWHDTFVYHWREKVTIAYNPESLDSVLVYGSNGKLICEAWDMRAENPHFKLADVRNARKKHLAMLRGIKQRGKEYMEEVWRDDRRVEQRKNYEVIREQIKTHQVEVVEESKTDSEMDELRKLFLQQDVED